MASSSSAPPGLNQILKMLSRASRAARRLRNPAQIRRIALAGCAQQGVNLLRPRRAPSQAWSSNIFARLTFAGRHLARKYAPRNQSIIFAIRNQGAHYTRRFLVLSSSRKYNQVNLCMLIISAGSIEKVGAQACVNRLPLAVKKKA